MESTIEQSAKQQRRQSHPIKQERERQNAINFAGLPDQTAQVDSAAALRQSMLNSNNSNGQGQQQPQTGAVNVNPLAMPLLQEANIAAVARLLENNRTYIAYSLSSTPFLKRNPRHILILAFWTFSFISFLLHIQQLKLSLFWDPLLTTATTTIVRTISTQVSTYMLSHLPWAGRYKVWWISFNKDRLN